MTAPLWGLTSTTPMGSWPLSWLTSLTDTRACALIAGTNAPPQNHGRFDSVIFASTIEAAQGCPSLKFVPPSGQYLSAFRRKWTLESEVVPTCTLYGLAARAVCLPEYCSADF